MSQKRKRLYKRFPARKFAKSMTTNDENCYLLVSPNDDKEIRSEIVSLKILISDPKIGCHRFSKFSSWKFSQMLHIESDE
jgi:hypothetical protein